MRVAFATTDGVNVNEHFGRAGKFSIYEVTKEGYEFIEDRRFTEDGAEGRDAGVESTRGDGAEHAEHEKLVEAKVDKLSDCRLIYMEQIGGPSAARLSRKGIMPMKVKETVSIKDNLDRLLETIRGNPPIWLKRAIEGK